MGKYIYYLYAILHEEDDYTLVATLNTSAEAQAFVQANLQYWEVRIHESRRCLNAPVPKLENDTGVLIISPNLEASCVRTN